MSIPFPKTLREAVERYRLVEAGVLRYYQPRLHKTAQAMKTAIDTIREALESAHHQFQNILDYGVAEGSDRDKVRAEQDILKSALASLKSLEGQGWVSVDERLPELHQVVALVHVDKWWATGRDEGVNCYDVGYLNEFGQKYWSIRGERASMISAYSHWMPLPSAPALTKSANP